MKNIGTLLFLLFFGTVQAQKSEVISRDAQSELSPWAVSLQYHHLYSRDKATHTSEVFSRKAYQGYGFLLMLHRRWGGFGLAAGASYKSVGTQFEFPVTDMDGEPLGNAQDQYIYQYIGVPVEVDYTYTFGRNGIRPFVGYEYVSGLSKTAVFEVDGSSVLDTEGEIDGDWNNSSYFNFGIQYQYRLSANFVASVGMRGEYAFSAATEGNTNFDRTLFSQGVTLGMIYEI